ncbi:polysaccharide pyruvyl transferase family protein [Corynebacterium marquesiae]|uniref:polysaccharide pyruvyl transferase family protein n=1 Tax=Corynebacterium marquesiae TaxID=2913503 RepID=UPI0018E1B5A4|nr:polysaccharide pyruvyl transferase family protein [Corynebacterium tuberculostearicum]
MNSTIATNGIRLDLPIEFPLEIPENSGNIIHGNAPRNLFGNTMSTLETSWRRITPSGKFREYVSENCSHLIITMANFFRVGDFSPTMRKRYDYFSRALDGYDKPIILFGLGSQAKEDAPIGPDALPIEGQRCLKKIIDKTAAVSVRGDYTRKLIESVTGPAEGQIFVTGCPSYFSRPDAFVRMQERLEKPTSWRATAVNVTNYAREADQSLIQQAVNKDLYLVEPENKFVHGFYVESMRSGTTLKPPEVLDFVNSNDPGRESKLKNFITSRYRLFRHFEPWIDFNREFVSETIGTRFHVNMASLLSGVPAVWVTHDARTVELTETLSLPSVPLSKLKTAPVEELIECADFDSFFRDVPKNFERFNEFLNAAGLPLVEAPQLTAKA